jgi:hypothetical protein
VPALQAQSPQFKPQSRQLKKKKKKLMKSDGYSHMLPVQVEISKKIFNVTHMYRKAMQVNSLYSYPYFS